MTFVELLKQPIQSFQKYSFFIILLIGIIVLSSLYPSDLEKDYSTTRGGQDMPFVVATEKYGRHINTLMPFALALISRDKNGIKQLLIKRIMSTSALSSVPGITLLCAPHHSTRISRAKASATSFNCS